MARRLLSHARANVIGYLALFVALGGVAWAAADPLLDRRGSVDSSHIQNREVRANDLARNLGIEEQAVPPGNGKLTGDWAEGQLTLDYRNGEVDEVIYTRFPLPGVQACTALFLTDSHTTKNDQYVTGTSPRGETVQLHIRLRDANSVAVLQGTVTRPTEPTSCAVPVGLFVDR